jgi:UDP-3-O-[3-hydroxymyristoyl] N-acetylglucosamine deacetylase
MHAQRTLRRPISCAGIGLHSGHKVTLSLKPASADAGIRFRRSDLGGQEVPATVSHVGGIKLATGLMRDTVRVDTVEHLLAAFVSLGVDNAIVELNSPEVPIMDGSAAPFTYLIQEAGIKPLPAARRYLKVLRPISLSRGDKRIALYPSDHSHLQYRVRPSAATPQSRTIRLTEDLSRNRLAARSGSSEVEMMRQQGWPRRINDNAIVIGDTGVLNNALRFDDEFVPKILT